MEYDVDQLRSLITKQQVDRLLQHLDIIVEVLGEYLNTNITTTHDNVVSGNLSEYVFISQKLISSYNLINDRYQYLLIKHACLRESFRLDMLQGVYDLDRLLHSLLLNYIYPISNVELLPEECWKQIPLTNKLIKNS